MEPERNQKGDARREGGGGGWADTGQGKRRDRKAIFCKVYTGPLSTHLADKRELAFLYVVPVQPKGEDSS